MEDIKAKKLLEKFGITATFQNKNIYKTCYLTGLITALILVNADNVSKSANIFS